MPRLYDSPEHESFRAAARCMLVNFGENGVRAVDNLLQYMGVRRAEELSPVGANYCRKLIEQQLPLRGDYAQ